VAENTRSLAVLGMTNVRQFPIATQSLAREGENEEAMIIFTLTSFLSRQRERRRSFHSGEVQ
jgi:hypothetical protein